MTPQPITVPQHENIRTVACTHADLRHCSHMYERLGHCRKPFLLAVRRSAHRRQTFPVPNRQDASRLLELAPSEQILSIFGSNDSWVLQTSSRLYRCTAQPLASHRHTQYTLMPIDTDAAALHPPLLLLSVHQPPR